MHRPDPYRISRFSPRPPAGDPLSLILAFAAVLLAALAVMVLLLPSTMVLPAFSVWALAAACAFALLARLRADRAGQVNAWDIAGACTLIGCAAGIMGEIEPVLEYFRAPASTRSKVND